MIQKVRKSIINGLIAAPSSKSALQRLIAGAFLANGQSTIAYKTLSDDAKAALKLVKALGAGLEMDGSLIKITGGINKPANKLFIGESGLGLRMFTPILALFDSNFEITGSGSLVNRPVDFIVKTLANFGVDISSDNGKLPLKIKGPYKNTKVDVDGEFSSQLLTGLLMALPLAKTDSELSVLNLKSKPYIDLTIDILNKFGILIKHKNYELFQMSGNQKYKPIDLIAEGDWSGAAFLVVAGAIAGKIRITDIDLNSTQGDKAIVEVAEKAGAKVTILDNGLEVSKKELFAFEYDATDTPDLFPPLVALAIYCKGASVIYGVNRLIHKESNRALTLKTEFEKIGAKITLEGDKMTVEGGKIKGAKVFSHHDHRIAMALAVAGLQADGEMIIEDSEAVGKSWPDFFDDLSKIGGEVL
ncbi:MAG: 3-phosphoshikimate 1-carboxyvinyltransferase [Bacteroidetes bacterium 4572_117]|nr:MAG: 3-phosphoshikimate 1-carboxyvinyltransferase [Bacteroidetes bacterium 4572_117]